MHSYYTKTLRVTKTDLTSKSLERLSWITADEQRAAYVRELHVTYLHGRGIRRGTLPWHFRAPCRPVIPQPASQELQHIVRRLSNCDSFWFDHTDPVSDWHRPCDRPPIADTLAIILPALADCGRKIRGFQFDTQGESYEELKPLIKTNPFRLESLVLYRTHGIASESLTTFLRTHSETLREIRFNRVTLIHGSWIPVFKSLATPRGFPALRDICLAELFQPGPRSLGCLDLSKAVQDQSEDGISGDQVRLAHGTAEWHCWPQESICYAGPRMDIAFRRIADGAVLKS
jgi:hypothetical protein